MPGISTVCVQYIPTRYRPIYMICIRYDLDIGIYILYTTNYYTNLIQYIYIVSQKLDGMFM